MAADYASLQTEIITWLKKSNDPDFVAIVPTLIEDAEGHFNRVLRTWEMDCYLPTDLVPIGVTEATLGLYDLPTDWAGGKLVEIVGDELRILYFKRIPQLNGTTQTTNWLLDKHPELYRYGALVSAEGYLGNDERIPVWKTKFEEILARIQAADWMDRNIVGGSLRATMPGERFWEPYKGIGTANKKLDFLPPDRFFEAVSSEYPIDANSEPWIGYYTVAAQKIRIWPKPPMP